MGGLSLQKKLASQIMKVGKSRVWMDPEHREDLKNAVTRFDIKKMISHGYIKAKKPKIKLQKPVKKKKKGPGSRKGSRGARLSRKRKWINTVRPLRNMLKSLRDDKNIDASTYRKLYLMVKAGSFRSKAHLRLYLEQKGVIDEKRS